MSQLTVNTLETHNPVTDNLDITAADVLLNGTPLVGVGRGHAIVFEPGIVASSGNRYKTWAEVITAISAIPVTVDLYVHKPGISQTEIIPLNPNNYDLSRCRILATYSSYLPNLNFTDGIVLTGFPYEVHGVNIVNNNTGSPLYTAASPVYCRAVNSAFINSVSATKVMVLCSSGVSRFTYDTIYDPVVTTGYEVFEVSVGATLDNTVLNIQDGSTMLSVGGIFRGAGSLTYRIQPAFSSGFNASNPNHIGSINFFAQGEERVDAKITTALSLNSTPTYKVADVVATTNITIATTNNGSSIDAVVLNNSIVLLVGQTTTSENGLYLSATSGGLTRLQTAITGVQVAKNIVIVQQGVAGAGKIYRNTNVVSVNVGPDPLTYEEVSLVSSSASTGMTASNVTNATSVAVNTAYGEKAGAYATQWYSLNIDVSAASGTVSAEMTLEHRSANFTGAFEVVGVGSVFSGTSTTTFTSLSSQIGTPHLFLSFQSLGIAMHTALIQVRYLVG